MKNPKISVYVVKLTGRQFFYFQWIDPTTGKRKTKSSKCTTRRAAERAASAHEAKLNSLQPAGDGRISWDDFVDLYVENHLKSLRKNSMIRVLSVFSLFRKVANPKDLASITPAVLSEYAAAIRVDPKTKETRTETTVNLHLVRISTALRWARERGHLSECPAVPKITRSRGTRAKGRPLTGPEFVKLLRATSSVVGRPAARSWRRLLIGLWLSGLRLEEALGLVWGDGNRHESTHWIDTSGARPLLGVVGDAEKSGEDRLLPLTPDFVAWLMKHTPVPDRKGRVFPLVKRKRKNVINAIHVSKMISAIGKAAKVAVNSAGKYASSHDLRRSFGLRWAQLVMPAQLKLLMRHEDISTTMNYYATFSAQAFADDLWRKFGGNGKIDPEK